MRFQTTILFKNFTTGKITELRGSDVEAICYHQAEHYIAEKKPYLKLNGIAVGPPMDEGYHLRRPGEIYITDMQVFDYSQERFAIFEGPKIRGISFNDVQAYMNEKKMGACRLVGLLVSEIPIKSLPDGSSVADFENAVEYDTARNN